MVQLYCKNYAWTDIEHYYEKGKILDQKNLVQGRVPFKKTTAVARFAALMLEEADVSKSALDSNDRKKNSIVIKK